MYICHHDYCKYEKVIFLILYSEHTPQPRFIQPENQEKIMTQDKNETIRNRNERMNDTKEEKDERNRKFLPIVLWTD